MDTQSVVFPCWEVHNLLASDVTESVKERLIDEKRTVVPRDGVCFPVYVW